MTVQQTSLPAQVAALQLGAAKQQIAPAAAASSKIYTRPELLAMKWADRQQGKNEGYDGWYRGGFDDGGQRHGLGRLDYDSGIYRIGERHGLGRWDYHSGMYEIGEYDHDSRCGHWIRYNKDGSIWHEWDA